MEFKKLEIEEGKNPVVKFITSKHFKKTVVFIFGGAILGFLFFYFTEGMFMDKIPAKDIWQSILIGAFVGFFITNSPCARGKC